MSFSYSNAGTKYFLEVKGHPGKLYLERFQFGNGEFELEIDGHKTRTVRSPLHFDIVWPREWNAKRLEEALHEYHHPNGPGGSSILSEILIGVETIDNNRHKRGVVQRLFHCRVMRTQGRKKSADTQFEIDFRRTG